MPRSNPCVRVTSARNHMTHVPMSLIRPAAKSPPPEPYLAPACSHPRAGHPLPLPSVTLPLCYLHPASRHPSLPSRPLVVCVHSSIPLPLHAPATNVVMHMHCPQPFPQAPAPSNLCPPYRILGSACAARAACLTLFPPTHSATLSPFTHLPCAVCPCLTLCSACMRPQPPGSSHPTFTPSNQRSTYPHTRPVCYSG